MSSDYDAEEVFHAESHGQSCDIYYGLKEVPVEWVEPLWGLYDESFHGEEAVQEQSCYTRETFIEALSDHDYYKVVLTVDGEAVGFCLATNNLEKASVAYVNPYFIRKSFPAEAEEGRFWYITCIYISPRLRNLGFIRLMVKASIGTAIKRDYVLGYDVSDARVFLTDMFLKLGEEEGFPLERVLLGTQSYFAFRKPREG